MNSGKLALATVLVVLASCKMHGAEMIEAVAGQCGLDNNSVQSIVDEVMAAKAVAEIDMQDSTNNNLIPERSGINSND